MSETYVFLQHYWWFLVSLLGALLVFLMFVQGGQSLLWQIGRTEEQRRMLLLSLGRKWELTFTTLVTFGGAFFASFPLFYSTSFGGAYWVWMLILLCFVVQAVSYEFGHRRGNLLGTTTFRCFLVANGVLGPLLVGAAVGTFFTGAEFVVDKSCLTDPSMPVISSWVHPLRGLEAVLDWRNVAMGLTVFFLARLLACLYFLSNIQDPDLRVNCRRRLPWESGCFLLVFLATLGAWLTMDGYAAHDGVVSVESHKYLRNLLDMPAVAVAMAAGVAGVLVGIIRPLLTVKHHGIWFAGPGAVLTVLSMLLCAGWNDTAYYPSTANLQSSLTLANSCSSEFTLRVMSVVSLLIPFVLAYIVWAWRALDSVPVSAKELREPE